MKTTVTLPNGQTLEFEVGSKEDAENAAVIYAAMMKVASASTKQKELPILTDEPMPRIIGMALATPSYGPSPPPVERLADEIMRSPNGAHSASQLIHRLAGEALPTRIEGHQNPMYVRWIQRIKAARDMIEEKTGAKFTSKRDGVEVYYSLER